MRNLSRTVVMIIEKDRNVHEVISEKYNGYHWTWIWKIWIWEMSYRQELYLSSLATIILCNKNHKTSVTYNKQKTFIFAHVFMGWLDRSAT